MIGELGILVHNGKKTCSGKIPKPSEEENLFLDLLGCYDVKKVITDIARGEADLDTLKAGASLIPVAKITKVPKVVKAIGNVGKTGFKKGKEGEKIAKSSKVKQTKARDKGESGRKKLTTKSEQTVTVGAKAPKTIKVSPKYVSKKSKKVQTDKKVIKDNKKKSDKSRDNSFYINNWEGYPDAPRPKGPFRILEGDEYTNARKLANKTNRNLHKQNPELDGLQIHEMHPVKFGGSPTNIDNKIALTPKEHAKYTIFWNRKLKELKGKNDEQ